MSIFHAGIGFIDTRVNRGLYEYVETQNGHDLQNHQQR